MTDDKAIEKVVRSLEPAEGVERRFVERVVELARAQAAHQERHVTHSDECWRWHLGCAVKEVARLRALLAEPSDEMVGAALVPIIRAVEVDWDDPGMTVQAALRAAGRAALGEKSDV